VTPLGIILSGPDRARWRTALGLAAAQAAHGGAVTLFVDLLAVPMLAPGAMTDEQPPAGVPPLSELLDACLDLGGRIIVCQSGLAAAGLAADALDNRYDYGGMSTFLGELGEGRLVIA
jgi:predicted peroxiredoxin